MSDETKIPQREPDGWAYRYPDFIRFNNGQMVNGCDPLEVIPFYFGRVKTPEHNHHTQWDKDCPACKHEWRETR